MLSLESSCHPERRHETKSVRACAVLASITITALMACGPTPQSSQQQTEQQTDLLSLKGCGNGICSGKETCDTCPRDCGVCPPPGCGDGACNGTETCDTCNADCGACPSACGDLICNGTETCDTCNADCGGCPAVCGDGTCNGTETCSSCPDDCGACPPPPTCGNGSFDPGEYCDDGNIANGDGCSATCSIEQGWTCSGAPSTCTSTTTFTIGGTLTGLEAGETVVLVMDINDALEFLMLNANGSFTFSSYFAAGAWFVYFVNVDTQPSGQECTVANGYGVIWDADATNVDVTCATAP
jgi:cysteine-rich repeat protein